MALRLIEGFDDGLHLSKGWIGSWNNNAPNINAGRLGGNSLAQQYLSGAYYTFPGGITGTAVLGFATKPAITSPDTTLVSFGMARLRVTAGGGLSLRRSDNDVQIAASSGAVWPSANAWRYLEIKYSSATGACTVRVDGVVTITGTLPTQANIPSVIFHDTGNTNIAFSTDDIYVLDTTGTTNNDFLGDVRVQTLYPSADGSNLAMTPSTGTTHYNLVNETTANTTNYVSTPTVGLKDSYQYQDLSSNTASVFGIQATAYAHKDATGTINLRNMTRIGSTNYSGATTAPLSISWTANTELWEKSPATSSSWSPAEVNAAEFGVETV